MEPSSGTSADGRTATGRGAMIAGATITTIGAFLFRLLTPEFLNDHFVHLARARQIVLGELPVRDFFDPGAILQNYTSAAMLAGFGHHLFGEAVLTSGFIAAGAGLTFVAAARLSRSFWIALAATLVAIISMPRLYSYPKVFFYALALVVGWHYAQRPARRTLWTLAAVGAVAFLYRHDHGVYIGLGTMALLAVVYRGHPRRIATTAGEYLGVTLLVLLPFFAFVQLTVGLPRYLSWSIPQAEQLATPQVNWLPVTFDPSAPFIVVSPPAERRINVRWAEGIEEMARKGKETQHRLSRPEAVEGSTWSYVLSDEGRQSIAALVDDPLVADTSGIDRGRKTLDISEPLYVKVARWIPLFRMQLAPGLFSETNALAWFSYTTLLLPFVGLAMVLTLLRKQRIGTAEAAAALMTFVLGIIVVQTLVRGSPDSRLADVANPVAIGAAWIAARILPLRSARVRRYPWLAALVVFWAVTTWSVATVGHVGDALYVSRILTGPEGIWGRLTVVHERLREQPIANLSPEDPGVQGLTRYVFDCTAETDRVFVAGFAPDVFFNAERAFGGGQVYLHPNWYRSEADQRQTVERLAHQRVPIILENTEFEYKTRFPIVYAYVHERYVSAPVSSAMYPYRVLVDRHVRPSGTYPPLGLPCFR